MDNTSAKQNPLLTEEIRTLLPRFAIPAITSNLVSALYNIIDQIYIGHWIGYLGNAATNVALPITTVCMAIALFIGVGAASHFNLELGKGNRERAREVTGTAFGTLLLTGILITLLIHLFMNPLLYLFGSTGQIYPYALEYVRITSFGIPFLLLSTGGNQLIRSDGSPKWSMLCMVSGAVLNVILDFLFMYVFTWGIAGAAWATVISQMVSALCALAYLPRFKNITLTAGDFLPRGKVLLIVMSLGLTPMFNRISTMFVQIVMNNLLRFYGTSSAYGSEIPLAVAGIVTKVDLILSSVIMGVIQGMQPITGINYGAGFYGRVRSVFRMGKKSCILISLVGFSCFQLFARQIISLFGAGNPLYMEFAVAYMRTFLFCTFLNGTTTLNTLFFSQIGKARYGALLSLTRQIFLLIPFMILFAAAFGLDGIRFAGPASDFLAFLIAFSAIRREFQRMPKDPAPLTPQ